MELPKAALRALAIIVLIETVFLLVSEPLTGVPVFQPTVDDAVAASKRNLLPSAGNKVVLLGDSSSLTNLNPAILEQQAEMDFINLGILSSLTTTGFTDIGLEVIENRLTRPAAIVYAILPQSLEASESDARRYGFVGRYLIAYNRHPPDYEPSFSDFKEWFLKKHRFNIFPSRRYGVSSGYQEFNALLQDNKGFLPELQRYSGVQKVKTDFQPNQYSIDAIVRLANSAKEIGIPFILLINPKPIDSVSTEYVHQVTTWLNTFATETGITVLGQNSLVRDPKDFGSEGHLSESAAGTYSVETGRLLVQYLNTTPPPYIQLISR